MTRFSRCDIALRINRTTPPTARRFETITIESKPLVVEADEVRARLDYGVWPGPSVDVDLATIRRERCHGRSTGADFRLPRQREGPLQDVRQDLSPFRGADTASAERHLRTAGEASALQTMTHCVGNSFSDGADDVRRLRFQTYPGKLTPGGGIDERCSLSSRSEQRHYDEPPGPRNRRVQERIEVLAARAGQGEYPLQRRGANHCRHHSGPAVPLWHAEQHPGQRPIGLHPIDQHGAAERRAEDH